MPTALEKRFPNITKWINFQGWLELGGSPYDESAAKALDEGGCVFQGKSRYPSLDALLADLDHGISVWCSENGVDLDKR